MVSRKSAVHLKLESLGEWNGRYWTAWSWVVQAPCPDKLDHWQALHSMGNEQDLQLIVSLLWEQSSFDLVLHQAVKVNHDCALLP